MELIILVYLILLPAVIGASVHIYFNKDTGIDKRLLVVLYAAGLFALSLLGKYLQGWAGATISDAFATVNSLLKYGIIEYFAAVLIPWGISIFRAYQSKTRLEKRRTK